jgi:hypothetical protein
MVQSLGIDEDDGAEEEAREAGEGSPLMVNDEAVVRVVCASRGSPRARVFVREPDILATLDLAFFSDVTTGSAPGMIFKT